MPGGLAVDLAQLPEFINFAARDPCHFAARGLVSSRRAALAADANASLAVDEPLRQSCGNYSVGFCFKRQFRPDHWIRTCVNLLVRTKLGLFTNDLVRVCTYDSYSGKYLCASLYSITGIGEGYLS